MHGLGHQIQRDWRLFGRLSCSERRSDPGELLYGSRRCFEGRQLAALGQVLDAPQHLPEQTRFREALRRVTALTAPLTVHPSVATPLSRESDDRIVYRDLASIQSITVRCGISACWNRSIDRNGEVGTCVLSQIYRQWNRLWLHLIRTQADQLKRC